MRKVSLIPVAVATCCLLVLSSEAQETARTAKASPSTTPTIDQSLEWKSAFNPKISPDGKSIAFLSDRPGQIKDTPEGKKQLYVISADGGEAQQITKTENDVNAFDWAPDSKRIAFSMSDPEPKAMKDRKEKYGEYSVVHADYQMTHLWTMEAPGPGAAAAEPKRVTDGVKFSVGEFSGSPDGTRIPL